MNFYEICESGDIDAVQTAITKGANDWNDGLGRACEGEQYEVVHLILRKELRKGVSTRYAASLSMLSKSSTRKYKNWLKKKRDLRIHFYDLTHNNRI